MIFGLFKRAQLARRGTIIRSGALVEAVRSYGTSLGIVRPVRVLLAPAEMMPATWGIVRPTVLLPPGANQWSPERLRLVLVHELSHVRRFDALTATIAHLATALAWWNPLVWLASRRSQLEREHACDDAVIRSGLAPSRYAEELLVIAQSLPSPFAQRLALAMAKPHRIERRLAAILDGTRRRTGTSHTVAALSSLVMALLWPLAATQYASALSTSVSLAVEPLRFVDTGNIDFALRPQSPAATTAKARTGAEVTTTLRALGQPDVIGNSTLTAAVPDFSGRWRLDGSTRPVEYTAAEFVAPFGVAFTAAQDADSLALEIEPISTYSMGRGRGSLAQVSSRDGTWTARFPFNGQGTNAAGGGTWVANQRQSWWTTHDSAQWSADSLKITTTQTSDGQNFVARVRRMRRDGNTIVVDTTTWQADVPRVTTVRYVRDSAATPQSPEPQSGPQPIPAGQFGAGAYRAGNGVARPYRIRLVKPVYTAEALKAGLRGTVELEAIIGADGTVTDVRITRSLDDKLGLDENAKAVVRQTPFVPCKIGNTAVACLVMFELAFTPGPSTPIAAGQFGAGAYRIDGAPIRLRVVRPQYTPEAMRQKIEGTVELEFVVGPDGSVTDVRVTKSVDTEYGLDDQAIKALKATPFQPPLLNGTAVSVVSTIEMTFTLR